MSPIDQEMCLFLFSFVGCSYFFISLLGIFGYDPQFASNVVIKNGVLGLSSHFAIHGNYNNEVLIENVHIKDFEVHGMQLNGFDNVVLRNLEVGPSSTQAYLNGEYGHMRYTLTILHKILDQLDEHRLKDQQIGQIIFNKGYLQEEEPIRRRQTPSRPKSRQKVGEDQISKIVKIIREFKSDEILGNGR